MNTLAFVTDDNAVNRKLASAFLKRLGWQVEEFDDAPAMMQRLRQTRPGVILLDISMPGMTGDQACQLIRQSPELAGLRVIAYTAHAQEHEHESFRACGFDDILVKPVSLNRLSEAVGAPGSLPQTD